MDSYLISGKSFHVVIKAKNPNEAKAKLYSELMTAEVRFLRPKDADPIVADNDN